MNKTKILHLLADGEFHSGQKIGAVLGITRSAVWKILNELPKEYGVSVYRVRGKGYRLAMPLSLFSMNLLNEKISDNIYFRESIDSTNTESFRLLADAIDIPPYLVISEMQTFGHGRRGRLWVSPYGQNIYVSYLIRVAEVKQLEALSLVVGIAVLNVLKKYGLADVGVKWPNDLIVKDKKISGILLELRGDLLDMCHIVIGVGINLNMYQSDEIDQEWTSFYKETGAFVDRNLFLIDLVSELKNVLDLHRKSGFKVFRTVWEKNHAWEGKEVILSSVNSNIIGTALGVSDEGELRLLVNGEERLFSGGELSLRLFDDIKS